MASVATIISGGSIYVSYVVPVSTSADSATTIYTTVYTKDSARLTIAISTYLTRTSILYTTYTSGVVETATPTYQTLTITSESVYTTYLPTYVTSVETTDGPETLVLSTLYGPIGGLSTLLTTYTTTIALSSPSSSLSVPIPIMSTAGLSIGAKAGIGIGITLAVLIFAMIAVGWFILQKRRRARPQLPEVTSSSSGGFEKPELDATEVSKLPDHYNASGKPGIPEFGISNSPTYSKTERGEVELDTAGRLMADGRVELEGRMLPRADVIKRKQVGSATAHSMIADKEVLHDA